MAGLLGTPEIWLGLRDKVKLTRETASELLRRMDLKARLRFRAC